MASRHESVRRHFGPDMRFHGKIFLPRRHPGRKVIVRRIWPGTLHFGHRVFAVTPWTGGFISSYPSWSPAPAAPVPHPDPQPGFAQNGVISLMLEARDELALSPDQIRQLEAILHDYERAAIRSEAELRIAELDLETMLQAAPMNMDLVREKLEEIESQRVEIRLARLHAIEKAKALLSPEQRVKLSTLLEQTR